MNDLTPTQDANLQKLAQRTIGFLVQKEEGDVRFLTPAGSGTIIEIRQHRFLLTAGHAAKAFMGTRLGGIYGIVAPTKSLRPVYVDPGECDAIMHWNGEHTPDGPDIAAIKLPPGIMEQIAQSRIVYNLDKRAAMKDEIKPMEDLILTGFPSTAKMRHVSSDNWQRHDMMTLSVVAGHRGARILNEKTGYDRFEFTANYVSEAPPETFEGVSGGALWYLDADKEDTVPMLAGVAYYQGDQLEDGNRVITCAGSNTVYAKLLQEVAEQWLP